MLHLYTFDELPRDAQELVIIAGTRYSIHFGDCPLSPLDLVREWKYSLVDLPDGRIDIKVYYPM